MKVTIQKELSDYMHAHNHNTISLRLIHDDLSMGNLYSNHPRIRWSEPKHVERFNKYVIDDITVFIEKDIKTTDDALEFIHETMLGVHRCHVRGLNLDYADNVLH